MGDARGEEPRHALGRVSDVESGARPHASHTPLLLRPRYRHLASSGHFPRRPPLPAAAAAADDAGDPTAALAAAVPAAAVPAAAVPAAAVAAAPAGRSVDLDPCGRLR